MTLSTEEKYEKPTLRRHSQFFAISPAGCKLGRGVFPFKTVQRPAKGEPGDDGEGTGENRHRPSDTLTARPSS